jgi:DNA primase
MTLDVRRLLASLEVQVDERLSDDVHLVCRCPLGTHVDNKPSFAIRHDDPDKMGLWICRSCGEGGNAVQLAARIVGVGFGVARQWVADHAEVAELPPTAVRVTVPPRPGGFQLPPEVILAPLEDWPTPARQYAQDKRGIEPWQVERWGLGHALGGRLDGRIVVPVRDGSGRVASYTARAYAGQPVRYLTPREEEGPDTSVLFGEEHAWEAGGAGVVVVEGALNALAVERVCEGPVLALGGSRVDPVAVAKLSRFRFVVVATDADPAGDRAAQQLLAALSSYVPVARARLPEGMDPANAPPDLLTTKLSEAVADVW